MKRGAEGYEGREIGGASPSGAKQKTVHPFSAQASPPLGGSRASHKLERHQGITSTASRRAVSRESAGEAVTTPEIEKQNSPVRRDSSVKTEVQLYL